LLPGSRERIRSSGRALANSLLPRSRSLLSQDSATYEIGGKTYTRQDLIEDTKGRMSRYQALGSQVASEKSAQMRMEDLQKQSHRLVAQAELALRQKLDEFEALKVRYRNAEEAGKIVAKQSGFETLLADDNTASLRELQRRVNVSESNVPGFSISDRGKIDWTEAENGKSVLESLDKVLGGMHALGLAGT